VTRRPSTANIWRVIVAKRGTPVLLNVNNRLPNK